MQAGYCGNALQTACERGHESVTRVLSEWKADVNAQGGYYGNALWVACERGHESVTRILLEWGADVRYYGKALQVACERGHGPVTAILVKWGAEVNAGNYGSVLVTACQSKSLSAVELLLQMREFDAKSEYFITAVLTACEYGNEETMRLLLTKKANVINKGKVHFPNADYINAMRDARESGNEAAVELLTKVRVAVEFAPLLRNSKAKRERPT